MRSPRPPRRNPRNRCPLLDSTPTFLAQGYEFIGRRCDAEAGDIADVRLLGRHTIVMRGDAAARLLYDGSSFHRSGALPLRVQRTLTGVGGVQSLDGAEHRHRKALFVDLLDEPAAHAVATLFVAGLRRQFPAWERAGSIDLLDACSQALCEAASRWVGLPPPTGRTLRRRTRHLRAMIESAAKAGPGHWRGRLARRGEEAALARLVEQVRRQPVPRSQRPLHRVAFHTDASGRRLPAQVAAVELLNLLRPIVAIARYVAFAVHALAVHPEARRSVEAGGDAVRRGFVHEVRRYYPFFPVVAAVASRDVRFGGRTIPAGTRVLLDLYGTNRHDGDHANPHAFHAGRYSRTPGPFGLVAQGGGDVRAGHRCPGEAMTVEVMTAAVGVLLDELDYVPLTRTTIPLRQMPTAPVFGPILDSVRRTGLPPDHRGPRLRPVSLVHGD